MNALEKIQTDLKPLLDSVNSTIRDSLVSSNDLLKSIIDFFLARRGKQIRPIFTLLLTKLIGEPNEKTISGAAAIELLHNASLIHDDVVDNSDMRRNVDTLNKIWDNQIAVLVGDFFVASGLERALTTGDIEIVSAISTLGRTLSLGELQQIYNAQINTLDEESYLKMIELKTASLFVNCAKIACLSVNASKQDSNKLIEFARLLGICFQIKDDTFDYCEQGASIIGKPVEADLREGKISLPLLHVLIEDKAKGEMKYVEMCSKEELTDQEINSLIEHACNNGGLEYSMQYMQSIYKKAMELISDFPNKEIVNSLAQLFEYVIERDH